MQDWSFRPNDVTRVHLQRQKTCPLESLFPHCSSRSWTGGNESHIFICIQDIHYCPEPFTQSYRLKFSAWSKYVASQAETLTFIFPVILKFMQYPEGHISKSIYAIFPLLSAPTSCKMLEDFLPNVGLAIWTTTPWTIPANAGKFFLSLS